MRFFGTEKRFFVYYKEHNLQKAEFTISSKKIAVEHGQFLLDDNLRAVDLNIAIGLVISLVFKGKEKCYVAIVRVDNKNIKMLFEHNNYNNKSQ